MHRQLAIPTTGHETSFTLPDNALNIRMLYTSGKGSELLLDELRLGHNGISASNEPSDTTDPLRPDVNAAKRTEYEVATPVWDPAKWSTGHVELYPVCGGICDPGTAPKTGLYARNPACRQYELQDHLGNIRVVISGIKKSDILPGTTTPANYCAEVFVMRDYYAFGMLHPVMQFVGDDYRYGFNGMEMDNELKGDGNSYDFGARMLDVRVGRWLSVDPLEYKYPGFSSHVAFANNPILFIDQDGRDIYIYDSKGKLVIVLFTDGEVKRYQIKNPSFSYSGTPVISFASDFDNAISENKSGIGNQYPDAVGIAVDATGALVGGMHFGFEMILFTRGPYKDALNFYFKFGGVIGLGGGAGASIVLGWNSDIRDSEMKPRVWTGKFNSLFGSLGPASGSYFWSTPDDEFDMNPLWFGEIAWDGVTIGIPKMGNGWGGGWIGSKYWHIGTVGGPGDGENGLLSPVDSETYEKEIKPKNESIGVLNINESEITTAPNKAED